jgi:prophage regulatory protein
MNFTANQPDRLLRFPAVAEMVGLKTTAIYGAVRRGEFPRPVKFGRASAWPESEVLAWIEARKAERNAA